MQYFVCTGRLCDNPSITQGQISKRAYFQIAVSRDIRREGGPEADFFNCVAFKERADFAEKYLKKGMKKTKNIRQNRKTMQIMNNQTMRMYPLTLRRYQIMKMNF